MNLTISSQHKAPLHLKIRAETIAYLWYHMTVLHDDYLNIYLP